MKKTATIALVSGVTLIIPHVVVADEKQLEKRLEVIEAKMAQMDAIKEENKQLKARLKKAEERLEKATAQKLEKVAPAMTVSRAITPESIDLNLSNIKQTGSSDISKNNWSGVYAGINAGYGKNSVNYRFEGNRFGNYTSFSQNILSGVNEFSGPVAGGVVGYNYQFANNFILGIESDFDYADITNGLNSATTATVYATSINNFGSSWKRVGKLLRRHVITD